MPRTKLQEKFVEEPIDWLKALMLYKINVRKGYGLKDLSADTGISYTVIRQLMALKDTQDWSRDQRRNVCRVLHITEEQLKATAHF